MRERAQISLLVAVAVVLLCFLGLLFYLSNVEMIETTMSENGVTDIEPLTGAVIYEDGRMWIRENMVLEDNVIDLPEGIEPGSLRIEHPEISGIRMIPPEEKDLMYTIETEDETYNGKYLWGNERFIAIEEDGKTVAINKDKVKIYNYIPQPEKANALELFYNGSMPTNITLSYVVDGAEFGIRYIIEGEQIEAIADIKSPVSLKNAKLTLRTGMPFGEATYKEAYRTEAAVPMAPMPLSAAREFEFYSFVIENVTIDSPLSLELFDGTIKAENYYYWSDSAVERRVRINNTLKNPLPSGIINYYDNSTWVGTTYMPYTAEGEESTITVGYSQDIKVEKNLTDIQIDKEKKSYEYTISVKNLGNSASNITIEQTLPRDATLVSTNPKAEALGNRIKWETMLKPKETKILVYRYRIIPLP
jgi:hypothetical protein